MNIGALGSMLLVSLVLSVSSHAGPFTDELSKCLVRSTSDHEKVQLARWVFAAMSSHPQVADLSDVDKREASAISKTAANIFVDLLAVKCRDPARQALQYEGEQTIEASFEVLGEVAMQALMSDPSVSTFIEEMAGLSEEEKRAELRRVFESAKPFGAVTDFFRS